MTQLRRFLNTSEMWLISGPALAALCLVAEQALARYFFPSGLVDWAEEITVYLIIWSVFLSLGKVSGQGTHIRTELVIGMLPKKVRDLLEAATTLLGLVFMIWLAWYGWEVARQAFVYDDRTSSSLRFPIWIYFTILPLGCLGMATGFLIHLLGIFAGSTAETELK